MSIKYFSMSKTQFINLCLFTSATIQLVSKAYPTKISAPKNQFDNFQVHHSSFLVKAAALTALSLIATGERLKMAKVASKSGQHFINSAILKGKPRNEKKYPQE